MFVTLYRLPSMWYWRDIMSAEDWYDYEPLVLDFGSNTTRMGFAGEDAPRISIPTVTGRYWFRGGVTGFAKDVYCGDEVNQQPMILAPNHPIERGVVTDWKDFFSIWNHATRYELSVAPEEHPVLLTEAPLNPKANREKMAEELFEDGIGHLQIANQAVLSLYSTGKINGVVLDCGDGSTRAVPVYDGYAVKDASHVVDLAGIDLTEKLQKIISKSGYNIAKSIRNYKLEISLVRDIKEKLCYIAIDVDKEVKTANFCTPSIYKLPDGKEIVLGIERFQCPEGLFQPSLLGKECAGIHTILNESITKCDAVFQKELYSNIVLSGGTTLLPGFVERMRNCLAQHKTDFNITVPRELKHSVWLGGSILACLCNSQKSMWISKQEYDEYGSSIVHSKCF